MWPYNPQLPRHTVLSVCFLLTLLLPGGGLADPPPPPSPSGLEEDPGASLYFLSLCLSLGCRPSSPSPGLSLPCLWLPFLSTVGSTQSSCAASRVAEGGAADGKWAQLPWPWDHTVPMLPHPHKINCLPTHSSSPTPSRHFPTGDGRRALSLFQQKGLQDFDTLLLSGDGGTLYVGARETILALDIQDSGMPKLKNMVRRPGTKGLGWECGGGWQLSGAWTAHV